LDNTILKHKFSYFPFLYIKHFVKLLHGAGGVAHMVESLPSKCEALSSRLSTKNKTKQKNHAICNVK
jgi:hypothetical protein